MLARIKIQETVGVLLYVSQLSVLVAVAAVLFMQGGSELARWHCTGAPAHLQRASWTVRHDHGPQRQWQVLPLPCPGRPLAPAGHDFTLTWSTVLLTVDFPL